MTSVKGLAGTVYSHWFIEQTAWRTISTAVLQVGGMSANLGKGITKGFFKFVSGDGRKRSPKNARGRDNSYEARTNRSVV
jgi:hypothetical protein